jgi:hypothetical protein
MKQSRWRKHHKWLGLVLAFFLLMFCLSGMVLNHRTLASGVNISRQWLPDLYRYHRWNNGLLRGTLPYAAPASREDIPGHTRLLLYGSGGIWLTDSTGASFTDFNRGLPPGADYRQMRSLVQLPCGALFAATPLGLYRRPPYGHAWERVSLPLAPGERLTDLTRHGDTLVVAGRSRLYLCLPPYRTFRPLELRAPADYDGKVSLFRTVWLLHSGELFGTAGKLLVDGVALTLILLTLTGLLYWWMPRRIRRAKRAGRPAKRQVRWLKASLGWHTRVGVYTLVLTLFVSLTGWMLRPPVLLALVYGRVPPVPGSVLSSSNAWNDRLRMIRYDEACGDWLLSSADGFYHLPALTGVPVKIAKAPPVSVMGVNVFTGEGQGTWLVGSFSGLFRWDRRAQRATDYFTGQAAPEKSGAPFGLRAVAGYSADFAGPPCVVEYYQGTDALPMPERFAALPMSLWSLSLEIHTGRIYTFLGSGTLFYICVVGLLVLWLLWSGYKIRRHP